MPSVKIVLVDKAGEATRGGPFAGLKSELCMKMVMVLHALHIHLSSRSSKFKAFEGVAQSQYSKSSNSML